MGDEAQTGANADVGLSPPPDAAAPSPAPSPAPVSDAPADPSPAPESREQTKETLLEHVLKSASVPPSTDQPAQAKSSPDGSQPSSPPQAESTSDDAAPTDDELKEDPSPEEMARYHSRTRARMKFFMQQRDHFRTEAAGYQADAQALRDLRTFLQEAEIQKEDFDVLLHLGKALRKFDYKTFLEGVTPYVQVAQEALGYAIPQDLRQQVEQGQMTSDAARRFAQERINRQIAEVNAQKFAQQNDHVAEQQNLQRLQQGISQAVLTWENGIRQQDPDYAAKQDLVKEMLWSVIAEVGRPQSPDHGVQIAQEAYRRVNTHAQRFRPKPAPTLASPSSVHRAPGATPEPKSLMEAARIGLERARRTA